MAEPAHLSAAASQFPQYHFQRSTITSSSLENPSYLRQLAAYPLPASAQDCLGSLPASIARSNCGHQLLAAVSSEHDVKLYNYTVGAGNTASRLDHFGSLRGHTRAVHDVKFHNVHSSFDAAAVETLQGRCMLSTASEDGTIKFWDVRQQKHVMDFKHPKGKPFISCASAGTHLAGASGSVFYLWDLRSSALLAENEDFHTEDINQLAFHPLDSATIFSGSEDGLICVLNPSDPDQDEWLQNVLNIENPVSRFGFFGPQAQFLWALSTVETVSLWNIEECDRVSDFDNIRDNLSRSAHMPVDYLVDAHYEQRSQRLFLAAGCNDGQLVLAHVNKSEIQPFCLAHVENKPVPLAADAAAAASAAPAGPVSAVTGFALQPLSNDSPFALSSLKVIGPPTTAAAASSGDNMSDDGEEADILRDGEVLYPSAGGHAEDAEDDAAMEAREALAALRPIDANAEGHTATIRDVLWFDGAIVTGGEDSRICLWTTQAPGAGAAQSSSSSSSHKAAASPNNDRKYKPY